MLWPLASLLVALAVGASYGLGDDPTDEPLDDASTDPAPDDVIPAPPGQSWPPTPPTE